MAESRDRLSRAVDVAELFARRRAGALGIYRDQPDLEMALSTPVPRARPGAVGSGGSGTPRGRGGGLYGTPVVGRGRENAPIWMGSSPGTGRRGNRNGRRGHRRGSSSVLPSWHPRTPLRDITAVVRAIERRRERLRGSEAQEIGSPVPQGLVVPDSSEQSSSAAHLEHNEGIMSPIPTLVGMNRCPPSVRVQKLLLHIANQPSEDSELLTPQKKLLNSIETVEKVVKEELQRIKRTPSAKKAEREKKVRTLMSFR